MKSFVTRKSYTGIADLNVWFWICYDTSYTLTQLNPPLDSKELQNETSKKSLGVPQPLRLYAKFFQWKHTSSTHLMYVLNLLSYLYKRRPYTETRFLDLLRRYRHIVCWCETTVYPPSTSTGLRLHRKLLCEHYCNAISTYEWHYASENCEGIFW